MAYTELVKAIACPECGSVEWKKHGTISCSVAPFQAECSVCHKKPDVRTDRALCPYKEFVFRKFPNGEITHRGALIIRHLECTHCGKAEHEYEIVAGVSDEPYKTVTFGVWPNESDWVLPGEWVVEEVDSTTFDGDPITEPILFCSVHCMEEYHDAN